MDKPKKKKRVRPKIAVLYLAFWMVLLGLAFVLVVNQAGRYNTLRAELDAIEAAEARLIAENENLQNQVTFFDRDAYIENRAREWLGMMRPNEIIFRNTAVD